MKSLYRCTGLIGNPQIFVVIQGYSSRKSNPRLWNINNFRVVIKGFNQLKSPPAELCSSIFPAGLLLSLEKTLILPLRISKDLTVVQLIISNLWCTINMLTSTICGVHGMLCYAKQKDLRVERNKSQLGLQEINDLKHLLCDRDIQA